MGSTPPVFICYLLFFFIHYSFHYNPSVTLAGDTSLYSKEALNGRLIIAGGDKPPPLQRQGLALRLYVITSVVSILFIPLPQKKTRTCTIKLDTGSLFFNISSLIYYIPRFSRFQYSIQRLHESMENSFLIFFSLQEKIQNVKAKTPIRII